MSSFLLLCYQIITKYLNSKKKKKIADLPHKMSECHFISILCNLILVIFTLFFAKQLESTQCLLVLYHRLFKEPLDQT